MLLTPTVLTQESNHIGSPSDRVPDSTSVRAPDIEASSRMDCPRCQYDVGSVLDCAGCGTCPECGLGIDSARIARWRAACKRIVFCHLACSGVLFGVILITPFDDSVFQPARLPFISGGICLTSFFGWLLALVFARRESRRVGVAMPLWVPLISGAVAIVFAVGGCALVWLHSVASV